MGTADPLGILQRGVYAARLATSPADLAAAQSLRQLAFRAAALDQDQFDNFCQHVLIEHQNTKRLVCCFRLMTYPDGLAIQNGYAAQFYGLERFGTYPEPMIEIGRFCLHPTARDPDILRIAWAALTRVVDAMGAQMLFGCSSFVGTDPSLYADALAVLAAGHLAPERWKPSIKSANVVPLLQLTQSRKPDLPQAMRTMPPLLRSYISMGGWVSGHAVIDENLNTLHVFTGLEIAMIPPERARALRLIAL
jgi:L-ornithine Nalpha-acyltransferase